MKVVNGKIREEVREIRGKGQIGVLLPGDTETKTTLPVMEALKEKHPEMRIQDFTNPGYSSFGEYEQDPDVVPLEISEEDVQWVASKLSGAAGPSVTYVLDFQSWLLCFGLALVSLREEMTEWKYWLAND